VNTPSRPPLFIIHPSYGSFINGLIPGSRSSLMAAHLCPKTKIERKELVLTATTSGRGGHLAIFALKTAEKFMKRRNKSRWLTSLMRFRNQRKRNKTSDCGVRGRHLVTKRVKHYKRLTRAPPTPMLPLATPQTPCRLDWGQPFTNYLQILY
jgi:hypothetical protein